MGTEGARLLSIEWARRARSGESASIERLSISHVEPQFVHCLCSTARVEEGTMCEVCAMLYGPNWACHTHTHRYTHTTPCPARQTPPSRLHLASCNAVMPSRYAHRTNHHSYPYHLAYCHVPPRASSMFYYVPTTCILHHTHVRIARHLTHSPTRCQERHNL